MARHPAPDLPDRPSIPVGCCRKGTMSEHRRRTATRNREGDSHCPRGSRSSRRSSSWCSSPWSRVRKLCPLVCADDRHDIDKPDVTGPVADRSGAGGCDSITTGTGEQPRDLVDEAQDPTREAMVRFNDLSAEVTTVYANVTVHGFVDDGYLQRTTKWARGAMTF